MEVGRVDALLERGRWFRRVSKDLTVSLGGFVYYVKGAREGEHLEIGYDPEARELLFSDESGEPIGRGAIKGVSVKELLGEFEPYVGALCFQPELPLSWSKQGVVRLCETMAARLNGTQHCRRLTTAIWAARSSGSRPRRCSAAIRS